MFVTMATSTVLHMYRPDPHVLLMHCYIITAEIICSLNVQYYLPMLSIITNMTAEKSKMRTEALLPLLTAVTIAFLSATCEASWPPPPPWQQKAQMGTNGHYTIK